MTPRARWGLFTAVLAATASAACSALLGLEAPPTPGADADATSQGDGSIPTNDGSPPDGADTDAGSPVCTPLGTTVSDGATTTYYPLTQSALDDAGNSSWEFFQTTALAGQPNAFLGATFDGKYIYLAGRGKDVVRYDTTASFGQLASWSVFAVSALGIPGSFVGAVFDGRYVYFIPGQAGTSAVARLDTQGSFADPTSWLSFDLSTLVDGGSQLSGFAGGTFDGRYVYFVPHNNGAPDGLVVRYDTTTPEDAGADGGSAGFVDPTSWSEFDLATVSGAAAGFFGAVFTGDAIYFAPQFNNAFDGAVRNGSSSIAARFAPDAGFESPNAWSTFDTSNVNALASNLGGAGFDGRYVYFAPRGLGAAIVARFDSTQPFTSPAAWSSYDLTRIFTTDASSLSYGSVTFDGRFVYFSPMRPGFGTVVRYDTASTFTADCAWSATDLRALGGGAKAENYDSAVFDGQYLYLVPGGSGLVARFLAKSPPSLPALPAFHGSFL